MQKTVCFAVMLRDYLNEIKQFDLETTIIIVYSTFLLLLSIYMPHYTLFFPKDRFLDRLIISGCIYGIGPFLIFFVFRHKPGDFGIHFGKLRQWSREVLVLFIIMVVILVIAFKFTNLKNVYPLFRKSHLGANYFLIYQAVQLFHMCTWEFFFRGFMLFGLEKKFGRASILIQTIPFAIMHYRKPQLEAYGSIFAGIFLGIVALRARSFLPAALLHFSVALAADILGILM